ncbi:MAG: SlyX protein [Gammaproteobacteria bacterium]|nr:SlyX protein [Gammaproteobacteria bacterium]MCS5570793.1 SlyX family protein [Pseudomonadales bacterium]MEC9239347.1 SlyX family protein [Pseudomonadota bacterium]MBN85349.1 SlyX protein [Gammaproteobacteria bacterium]MED5555677.1 SlyX family protein [Pseudomonadota bacterium]|tara:strand:+ start:7262 stop:7474 length:213 start_codon:yes stop_codon:yes gene_type:complete
MAEQDPAARIEDLETKLTFQEDTIQKLNDVIVTCQTRVDEHDAMIRMLMEQVRTAEHIINPEDEPPPPHY